MQVTTKKLAVMRSTEALARLVDPDAVVDAGGLPHLIGTLLRVWARPARRRRPGEMHRTRDAGLDDVWPTCKAPGSALHRDAWPALLASCAE